MIRAIVSPGRNGRRRWRRRRRLEKMWARRKWMWIFITVCRFQKAKKKSARRRWRRKTHKHNNLFACPLQPFQLTHRGVIIWKCHFPLASTTDYLVGLNITVLSIMLASTISLKFETFENTKGNFRRGNESEETRERRVRESTMTTRKRWRRILKEVKN